MNIWRFAAGYRHMSASLGTIACGSWRIASEPIGFSANAEIGVELGDNGRTDGDDKANLRSTLIVINDLRCNIMEFISQRRFACSSPARVGREVGRTQVNGAVPLQVFGAPYVVSDRKSLYQSPHHVASVSSSAKYFAFNELRCILTSAALAKR